jgi:hypothetical protein
MASKRKTDSGPIVAYRSERITFENGQWFFFTREGTIEGPFRDKVVCLNQLDLYIKVMQSGMLSEENDEHYRSHYQKAS